MQSGEGGLSEGVGLPPGGGDGGDGDDGGGGGGDGDDGVCGLQTTDHETTVGERWSEGVFV